MGSLKFTLAILATILVFEEVYGHGMMLDPVSRSSRWRYDPSAPINYDDDGIYCGGFGIHWGVNGGKCGVCGDSYGDSVPRDNENTGKYGVGKVVAEYPSGSVIPVTVHLTANHMGWFNYSLCDLKDPSKPETEECFQYLKFEDGTDELVVDRNTKDFLNKIVLPAALRCKRCVLRWTYRAGNSWGTCEDGSEGMGCGPQETFKNCADISII